MAPEHSRGLQVGSIVHLESLGNFLYESSRDGLSRFVGREGDQIVKYSVPLNGIIRRSEGYILGNYVREVLNGSGEFAQAIESLRRARI